MTATDEQIEAASRQFIDVATRLPVFYKLAAEFTRLIDMLEEEQDEEAIQQELQRIAGDIRRKAHGIAVVIQSLENMAALQAAEAKRLAAKAKTNQSHADRLRAYTLDIMRNTPGCERIEAGYFTLAIRLNPYSVTVEDEAAVPSEFNRTRITVEVDKRAVLESFKATHEVPSGVSIGRTERLEIR
jgi:hypothetical protein